MASDHTTTTSLPASSRIGFLPAATHWRSISSPGSTAPKYMMSLTSGLSSHCSKVGAGSEQTTLIVPTGAPISSRTGAMISIML
ncbi:Uncharacterised protein [Mycobacteroides abscessus subsp. abscessus]|nr:Uncharacterised protein [Mycobacteroides abscessus subsp. abscessus]